MEALGPPGANWGTSGSPGGEKNENDGSLAGCGVAIWGSFWHQKRKNPQEMVSQRWKWQGKGKSEKNRGKRSSSRRGAHAIQPRLCSRNDVFVFDKKPAKSIENDLPNDHF